MENRELGTGDRDFWRFDESRRDPAPRIRQVGQCKKGGFRDYAAEDKSLGIELQFQGFYVNVSIGAARTADG